MGGMKRVIEEEHRRQQNTCPDCETEFAHSEQTGNVTCECGTFAFICPECIRGYDGGMTICEGCFGARVNAAP